MAWARVSVGICKRSAQAAKRPKAPGIKPVRAETQSGSGRKPAEPGRRHLAPRRHNLDRSAGLRHSRPRVTSQPFYLRGFNIDDALVMKVLDVICSNTPIHNTE